MKCISVWGLFYWVVPIVLITLIVVLFLENKKYRISILWIMLGIWMAALIYLLFIYRLQGRKDRGFTFDLFHMYRKAGTKGWEATQALRQILFNILLYMPLGCILAALTRKIWLPLFIGVCVSIITEALQGFTGLGWADVDDVVNNSDGVILGFL